MLEVMLLLLPLVARVAQLLLCLLPQILFLLQQLEGAAAEAECILALLPPSKLALPLLLVLLLVVVLLLPVAPAHLLAV
jgi:hypothetical protein